MFLDRPLRSYSSTLPGGELVLGYMGHNMFQRGIKANMTRLGTVLMLSLQSVTAIPASCNCSNSLAGDNIVGTCCQTKATAEIASPSIAGRFCCASGKCDCRLNSSTQADTTACACECSERDQNPFKSAEITDWGKNQFQQVVVNPLWGPFAWDSPIVDSVLESTHAAQGGTAPSVQVLFCIWLT